MTCSRIRRFRPRSEEHTSELQSHSDLVCRLLLEKKKEMMSAPSKAPDKKGEHQLHAVSTAQAEHVQHPLHAVSAPPAGPRRPRGAGFFFKDTASTEIYTLSLHDALPI